MPFIPSIFYGLIEWILLFFLVFFLQNRAFSERRDFAIVVEGKPGKLFCYTEIPAEG